VNRRRDININVATVTAGVRGTDLWGKSIPARQVVCLIEGKIEVGAPGETPVALDQPRQFYQRVNDQTQPVGFVDPVQLGEWAKETEIEAGKGAARLGGRFRVELAAADNQNDALAVYDQVRAAGYAAEIRPAKVEDKLVYRVQIRNLPSRAEAQALASRHKGKFGVAEPKGSSCGWARGRSGSARAARRFRAAATPRASRSSRDVSSPRVPCRGTRFARAPPTG
jgi:hypothetical protein